LGQDIPGTAKLVLIALANRADEETGHCWPSIQRIAKEASCSPRSVHTYIGALKRNGYVDVRSGRGKTSGGHTNDYWLLMDRPRSPWDFGKGSPEVCDPQDVVSATIADTEMPQQNTTETGKNDADQSANSAYLADGVSANTLQTKPSLLEPSRESSTRLGVDASPKEPQPPPPQALAPPGFDPKARQAELSRLQAAEEARSKNKRWPVIEGSEPWNAHVREGHPPTLVTWIEVDGRRDRGWYFRTLWPPRSTGPPEPGAEFADEFEDATET
jgi:hypothetical protein